VPGKHIPGNLFVAYDWKSELSDEEILSRMLRQMNG
jgi:hypothetical protein